jgi:hypothetical protein
MLNTGVLVPFENIVNSLITSRMKVTSLVKGLKEIKGRDSDADDLVVDKDMTPEELKKEIFRFTETLCVINPEYGEALIADEILFTHIAQALLDDGTTRVLPHLIGVVIFDSFDSGVENVDLYRVYLQFEEKECFEQVNTKAGKNLLAISDMDEIEASVWKGDL